MSAALAGEDDATSSAPPARAKRRTRTKARTLGDSSRQFRLTVQPGKRDTFGVSITEAQRSDGDGQAPPVVTATAAQTQRVLDAVMAAVRGSGHQPGRLSVRRGEPLDLDEVEGVRLCVILWAAQPITVNERIRRIVAGVNFMSVEETYYWYAKCAGAQGVQARKALRILLADPNSQV